MPASMRRPRSRSGRKSRAAWRMPADADVGDGAAAQAAVTREIVVMKGTSGERVRAEPTGALSRSRSAQTPPGRPLALLLTLVILQNESARHDGRALRTIIRNVSGTADAAPLVVIIQRRSRQVRPRLLRQRLPRRPRGRRAARRRPPRHRRLLPPRRRRPTYAAA